VVVVGAAVVVVVAWGVTTIIAVSIERVALARA
jgi:hypothetical protein